MHLYYLVWVYCASRLAFPVRVCLTNTCDLVLETFGRSSRQLVWKLFSFSAWARMLGEVSMELSTFREFVAAFEEITLIPMNLRL